MIFQLSAYVFSQIFSISFYEVVFFLYEVKLFFQMFLFKEGTGQFYGEIIAGGHGFNIANSKVSFRKTRANISV